MVKEEKRNNQTVYLCEECGFAFLDKDWAEKCEAFCKEHKSCSLEITEHALKD